MHQDDPCHTADTKPKSKRRDQSNDTLIRGNHHCSTGRGIDARLLFTPSYSMKVSSVDNAPPLGVDVIDKVVILIRHCLLKHIMQGSWKWLHHTIPLSRSH
jgi:hypothetical protein